jgi:hypothetical protein
MRRNGAWLAILAVGFLFATSALIGAALGNGEGGGEVLQVPAGARAIPMRVEVAHQFAALTKTTSVTGAKFSREGELQRLTLRLRPAPGVTIPDGEFECDAIRFNEAGEVVEIVPASSAGCRMLVIEDPEDPESSIPICTGDCPTAQICQFYFDVGTLELGCDCA